MAAGGVPLCDAGLPRSGRGTLAAETGRPALNRILDRFTEVQERFHSFDPERQREEVNQYSFREMEHLIDDIYENFDEFYLLLDGLPMGTRYEHFIDELTSIEVEYTYRYMEAVGCPGTGSREITEEFSPYRHDGVF